MMNKKICNNIFYLLWILLSTNVAISQTFSHQADLPTVSKEGYYKVLLKPEIIAYLNNDLGDIRILDVTHQEELPYLLHREQPSFDIQYFQEYPIFKISNTPKKYTELIIHNKTKNAIDNFCILTQNSDVYKTAKLTGSNDLKSWYIIKDDYFLSALYSHNSMENEKTIYFPLCNYTYFKLEINDSISNPILIKKVGHYKMQKLESTYVKVPRPTIVQTDSSKQKKTYIQILYDAPYAINKFKLSFSGPRFFNRTATLFKRDVDKTGHEHLEALYQFRVSSNSENVFPISQVQSKQFLITIENQDNKPLNLQSFEGYMLKAYLKASLSPNIEYSLKFGDRNTKAPIYDLEYFKDSIPTQLQEITPINIKTLKIGTSYSQTSTPWFKNKMLIWISIIAVTFLLGYVSFKMVKDIKANGQ